MNLCKALGAENIEEALTIIQTAGLQQDEIHGLMMDLVLAQAQHEALQPKLTRRQQLGIDPVPPELMHLMDPPEFANLPPEQQLLLKQQML